MFLKKFSHISQELLTISQKFLEYFTKEALESFGNEVTFNGLRRGTGGIEKKHPECTVPEDEIDVAGQFIQVMKS